MKLAEIQAYCQDIAREVMKELEKDLCRKLTPAEESLVIQTLSRTARIVANRLTNAATAKFLKDLA